MFKFRIERFFTHLFRAIGEHEGTIAVSALLLTVVALFVQECSSNAMLSKQVGVITNSALALHKDMETLTDRMYDLDGSIHVLDRGLITIQTSATIHMSNFKEATESFSENINISIQGQNELINQIISLNQSIDTLSVKMSEQSSYLRDLKTAAAAMQSSAAALQRSAAFVERVTEKIAENTIPQYLELRFANHYYLSGGVDAHNILIEKSDINPTEISFVDSLQYGCIREYLTYDVVNRQRWLPFFASDRVASERDNLLNIFKQLAVIAYPSTDSLPVPGLSSKSIRFSDNTDTLRLALSANQFDYPDKELYVRFPNFLEDNIEVLQRTTETGLEVKGKKVVENGALFYVVPITSSPDIEIVFKNSASEVRMNSANRGELFKFVDSIAVDVGGHRDYFLTVFKIPYYFLPDDSQMDPTKVDDRGALTFIPNTKENRKVLSDLTYCFRRQIGKSGARKNSTNDDSSYYFNSRLRSFEQQQVINLFFRKLPREVF